MRIEGKTALVTGGARGIGREVTRRLVERGAHVIVVGRNQDRLDRVLSAHGDAVSVLAADLADAGSVDRLVARLPRSHPQLSLLINNAAIQTETDFLSPADGGAAIRDEVAINLASVMVLCRALLPMLKSRDEAAIVNVTSALAIAPKRAAPVYCATKAGLRNFTRSLRYQCRRDAPHILVSEVVMALVDTDMTRGRGSGKISAAKAAESIVSALQSSKPELWVGKTGFLRIVNRLSPALAARILQ